MPIAEKEFFLGHVFKNVSSMQEDEFQFSEIKEHFGVPWKMGVALKNQHMSFQLYCLQGDTSEKWSIECTQGMSIFTVTGKTHTLSKESTFGNMGTEESIESSGIDNFMQWNLMMSNYVIDDGATVEVHVKIKKMSGIEKKNLRNFDESNKEFSNVVLVVKDQKFYVSKLYLASQSTYFNALFLRDFEESKQEEIALSDIDSNDFQNFLELLYGESPIYETTIEGILHLADMYDAKIAIRKCEQFLIEISEKSLKEKLKLAHCYRLNNLKDYCLSKITTVADIRFVLTCDLEEMDPKVVGALLRKALRLIP